MRLLIVRHGETDWNAKRLMQSADEPVLTDLGVKQTERLVVFLKDKDIDVIFCSPTTRTRQTLEYIKKELNAPVFFEPLILERNPGVWIGKPVDEFIAYRESKGLAAHEFKPERGESFYDVRQRAKAFWNGIKWKHADRTVLVVSHGTFNRVFINLLLEKSLVEGASIEQGNCCVNEFLMENGNVKVLRINHTGFLDSLVSPPTDSTG